MSEVFISYARETETYAKRVADALRASGFGVWYDEDLPAHRAFSEVIEERLREAKAVIVIWSAAAVKSEWVRAEADTARKSHTLVQLKVDNTNLPLPFSQIQCVDLAGWSGSSDAPGWRKVIGSVEELVGRATPQHAPISSKSAVLESRSMGQISWWAGIGAAVAVIVTIAIGSMLFLLARPPPSSSAPTAVIPMRVAVLPFDATGQSQDARDLADALTNQIADGLSSNHIEALPRGDSATLRSADVNSQLEHLRVGLVLNGEVRSDAERLRVRVHLTDVRAHATLWSKSFETPSKDEELLRNRVAARATSVTIYAADPAAASIRNRPDVLATYIDDVDELEERPAGDSLSISRDLVSRAPDFSPAHALLSNTLVLNALANLPKDAQPQVLAEAMKEAGLALKLDSNDGYAYGVLSFLSPFTAWREKDRLLAEGLSVQSNGGPVRTFDSYFLRRVGRDREAAVQAQQAITASPWAFTPRLNLAIALLDLGRADQAEAAIAEARQLRPDNPFLLIVELSVAASTAPPSRRVLGILDDPLWKSADALLWNSNAGPGFVAFWRTTYRTILSGRVGEKSAVARSIRDAVLSNTLSAGSAIAALCGLGDVDGAFFVADLVATPENLRRSQAFEPYPTEPLFSPVGAAMRRDRRFMPLLARLGLVDYWRSTGHWPDFCSEPGLPYDCKVEAERLSRPEHGK